MREMMETVVVKEVDVDVDVVVVVSQYRKYLGFLESSHCVLTILMENKL